MTSAYTLAQEIHTQYDVPGFPVLIEADLDTGKWQKKPLAKWGSIAVDTPPEEFNWAAPTPSACQWASGPV
jgi:hypothetical protein